MRKKLVLTLIAGAATAAVLVAAPGRRDDGAGSHHHGPMAFHADADRDGTVTAAEWEALFARMDTNSDGTLAGDELPQMRHKMPSAGAIAGFIAREADADRDGTVTAAEYEARVEALDADGDGVLTMAELHPRMRHGGPDHDAPQGLPPFVAEHDRDADGKLDLAELQALFAAADADGSGSLAGDELAPRFHHRGHR